ncbi:nucleoporin Gle1 [Monomorium pharaonis]|uniref:nucleoporin Gle1 n=1 Tax=Monomorium pharaonis TaxID=307658 RepID=UPI00063F6B12|nr:nucleoporin Gle1 [Monomorium pharaonis]XP_012521808.1 nucleoporin Gle1 [Monomorium pharaonis]XP_028047245.1 nucleoporin Gle1 [Monomorium pharaonis]XP_036149527.1 nucleoporin Gle1 [Monomorium pharaonis]
MSFHWDRPKVKTDRVNMDITSDFTRLKVSVLEKASRISATTKMDRITIGTQSDLYEKDSNKADNIENEQNSCNIKSLQRTITSPKHNMVATQKGISFSLRKIILEGELQRKEEVRKEMERRVQHMKENGRAIQEQMANSRLLMARERERQSKERLAFCVAEQDRIAEQEEIKRRHKQQLQEQRVQEQKEKDKREIEEYCRRVKEEELLQTMLVHRDQFTAKYCDLMAVFKTCKDQQSFSVISATHIARVKDLIQGIAALDEKIRKGEILAADVNIIKTLVCDLNDLLNVFHLEIEKINAQYEAELACKTQVASEVQKVEETDNVSISYAMPSQQLNESNAVENKDDQSSGVITNQEIAVASVNESITPSISESRSEEAAKDSACKKGNLSEHVDQESLQIYIRSQQILRLYKETCKDFLQSVATKKFRLECQKAINIPVNAISGVSEQHLRDKYDRLQNLLIGKLSPNVTQYPQGAIFCKNHLAKTIVSQGETLVSSKPESAFPVAMIVVALWNEHPDFGELFLAHLHEACPFIVPLFLQQQEGQSNEDYYKSLGCKYSEDGTVEKQDKFLKRMSGLMRLYASITVTRQRRGITKIHPHGLQYTWRWLAAVLNTEPRADICDLCATLILDMLEVAGNVLWTSYPKQFHKLLALLMEQYFPRMRNVAVQGSGPLSRLELFLSNALRNGIIRPADGMLPPNFL